MILKELFDRPQPHKWTRAGGLIFNRNTDDAKANFKIGNHQYVFNAFKIKPGVYKVNFGQVESNKKVRYDITNTGSEVPVFSTVANIITDFITTYDPQVIVFSAEEASRQKLYARLVNRLLKDSWQVKQDGQFFTLTKNPQLNELTGYKSNPHYQKARDIFDPEKVNLNDFNKRIGGLVEFQKYLVDNGFEPVGFVGSHGAAFMHPNYPWVLKLFTNDSGYLSFFKYAKQHQNNPYLPKIKGNIISINPKTSLVRLEKLSPVSFNDPEYEDLFYILKSAYTITDLTENEKIKTFMNLYYPEVLEILIDLLKLYPDTGLDVHRGNFMMRGDQLVILDPLIRGV